MIPTGTSLEQRRIPIVTATLIFINFVVFPFLFLTLNKSYSHWFMSFDQNGVHLLGFITSMFLHRSLMHLVFNMLFLWIFGAPIEERLGKKKYLLYYVGAGISGDVLDIVIRALPSATTSAVGASGAISGIIALYLYRCHHSKLKMVLDPHYVPFQFSIPAAPFILYWFLSNDIAQVLSFKPTQVAHWAHIGGFMFGLAVGRINRLGLQGSIEQLTQKIYDQLNMAGRWKSFKSADNLHKIAEMSPDNPDHKINLAQYYLAKEEKTKASAYYREAIQLLFSQNPLLAAFTVKEHLEALHSNLPLQFHIKAGEILAAHGYMEDAARIVSLVIPDALRGPMAEKVHILYLKLCQEAGNKEGITEGIATFQKLFPGSSSQATISEILSHEPGHIFTKKAAADSNGNQAAYIETEVSGSQLKKRMYAHVEKQMVIFTSPLFLFLWLGFYSMFIIGEEDEVERWISQFTAFFLAYVLIRLHIYNKSKPPKLNERELARLREADQATLYNRASLADRGENYVKAAELYEKVLYQDGGNIQARFRLAKIYQMHLKDRGNALRQYRYLLARLPKDHPYQHETELAIKNGCSL